MTSASRGLTDLSPLAVDWLYPETITPPCALWFGCSARIAQAVELLALQIDFSLGIFDDRPEFANHTMFLPEASLCAGHLDDLQNEPFAAIPSSGLSSRAVTITTRSRWRLGYIARSNSSA